jgi:hypothetical protein
MSDSAVICVPRVDVDALLDALDSLIEDSKTVLAVIKSQLQEDER